MSEVYSYHTFLFPFLWDNKGSVTKESFEKIFNESPHWSPTNWDGEQIPGNDEIIDENDARLAYNAYQYFNPAACLAIFGMRSGIVSNYSFAPKKLRNRATYYIRKGSREYRLNINAIKMKIFNTGVAVMIFETENLNYRNLDDVKMINQFGRRIAAPFLPGDSNFTLCADEIAVEFDEGRAATDFQENLSKNKTLENITKDISLTYIAHTLKDLMVYGTDYTVTSHRGHMGERGCYYISPIIDDRMFVACVVCDSSRVPEFRDFSCPSEVKGFEGYKYKSDFSTAKGLYSFCFVDDTDASCQDRDMIRQLLEDHLYTRFIEYGTIHAVTHHSMMCLTGDLQVVEDSVVNPFLTMYIEMAVLALVQRASIINFELLASKITGGLEKPGQSIGRKRVRKLLNLQERYLAFQNQLMFFEVTPQEQGVEIYDMLMESLYIEKEMKSLEGQLQNLYEATTVNQDFSLNKWALVIAIMAFAPSVAVTLKEYLPDNLVISSPLFLIGLLVIPASFIFGIYRRGKK